MRYRIKNYGKKRYNPWIKTDKTIEEIKALIINPTIQEIEWDDKH